MTDVFYYLSEFYYVNSSRKPDIGETMLYYVIALMMYNASTLNVPFFYSSFNYNYYC